MFDYQNSKLSIEVRIDDLLARMTLPEKVGQMLQLDAREGVERLVNEFNVGSILHTSPEEMARAGEYVAATRLRIPLLTADDAIHGHSFWSGATIYPTQLAMACSWNYDLIRQAARETAIEVSATGLHWTFSPVLCITRDLRWGRVGETFGEDPYLIGEFGSAMVKGYQGDGLADKTAVLATAKHFAGYSETQGGRDASEADLSPRKLRSWFLPPFERVAREGCRTFMLGYQSIDGVPITANKWLLNDVLKGEWGFAGTLVTDWDNVGRMVWEQKTQASHMHAAATAINAGNDLVMTTWQFYQGAQDAVANGLIGEGQIDEAVRRILRLKFELGLFEDPRLPDLKTQSQVIGAAEHALTNLELARRSLVLLANDETLPLQTKQPMRLAVVGPNANDAQNQLGDWAGNSGQINWMPDGHPRDLIETVLDGLERLVPSDWKVSYAKGAEIAQFEVDPLGETYEDGQPRPPIVVAAKPNEALLDEALALAANSDLVVAVVGDCIPLIGEYRSTATLELVGSQIELLDRLAATGKKMVVVVISSKPMVLPESAINAAAIIQAFNPGMRGGQAIAELILGHIEPSGRLPISFARHVGQQPIYYNQIRGQHGDRYADYTQDPLFAFGFGLSYSKINYTNLRLAANTLGADDTLRATVALTNVGMRPVLETVQAYISDAITSVTWATKELKGYRQILVQPGESVDVNLEIAVAEFSLVNAAGHRVVELGEFNLLVGASSRAQDLLVARFEVNR